MTTQNPFGSFMSPEEQAHQDIRRIIDGAFAGDERPGSDEHAALSRQINAIGDRGGLGPDEMLAYLTELTGAYSDKLKTFEDESGAVVIEDDDGKDLFEEEEKTIVTFGDLDTSSAAWAKFLEDTMNNILGSNNSEVTKNKNVEKENQTEKIIAEYGGLGLDDVLKMYEDGTLPPIPDDLRLALRHPTIKITRWIPDAREKDPITGEDIPSGTLMEVEEEIPNPIIEPLFNIYVSQLDAQVEAFRLKKAGDRSEAESADRLNQALISATGGLAGRDHDEDFSPESIAAQEELLARVAATGGLEDLTTENLQKFQREKALIAATGGLRGGDKGLSAQELSQQELSRQQIAATGGLSGFTPFTGADRLSAGGTVDDAARIQAQLFGTPSGQPAITSTRSLTPFEMAQMQLEPLRMQQAQEAAQRTEQVRQFDEQQLLRQEIQDEAEARAQQEFGARYGGMGDIGLDVRRQQEAESARSFAESMANAQAAEERRRFNEELAIGQRSQELSEQSQMQRAMEAAAQQQFAQSQLQQQRQMQMAQLFSDPNRVGSLSALYGPEIFQTEQPFGAVPITPGATAQTAAPQGNYQQLLQQITDQAAINERVQNLGYTPFGGSAFTTGQFSELSPFAQGSYLTTQAREKGKSVEELMREMEQVSPMGGNTGAGGLGGSYRTTGELY